jgi:hypothetical protein
MDVEVPRFRHICLSRIAKFDRGVSGGDYMNLSYQGINLDGVELTIRCLLVNPI